MKKLVLTIALVFIIASLALGQTPQAPRASAKEPLIMDYPGFWYVYKDYKGPYENIRVQFPYFISEFEKQGLKATGTKFAVYYNSPKLNKAEDLEWALALPVSPDAQVKPPLEKHEFKATRCVAMLFTDYTKPIQETNDKMDEFIDANDLITVWPAYEIYWPEPHCVEIVHPVAKKESTKQQSVEAKAGSEK